MRFLLGTDQLRIFNLLIGFNTIKQFHLSFIQ